MLLVGFPLARNERAGVPKCDAASAVSFTESLLSLSTKATLRGDNQPGARVGAGGVHMDGIYMDGCWVQSFWGRNFRGQGQGC